MSLKAFHILFITASIILCVLTGLWALNEKGYLWLAFLSFPCALGLAIYEYFFIKKTQSQ